MSTIHLLTALLLTVTTTAVKTGTPQNPDYHPPSDIQAILDKYKNVNSDGSNIAEILKIKNPSQESSHLQTHYTTQNTQQTLPYQMSSNIRENRFTGQNSLQTRQNTDRNTNFTKTYNTNISYNPNTTNISKNPRKPLYAELLTDSDMEFKPSEEYLMNYHKVYLEPNETKFNDFERKRKMQIEIDADNQRQARLEKIKQDYKENGAGLLAGYKDKHMKGFDQRNGITEDMNAELERRLQKRLKEDPDFRNKAGNFKDPHGIYEEFRNQDPEIKNNALARKFFVV